MINYRTDLAMETQEILEKTEKLTGFIRKSRQLDRDISVTHIRITDEAGVRSFGKPKGNYITIEVQGILEQKDDIRKRAARALAGVLKELVPFHYYLKVLVVGLGNEKVTPDSLGPHTVDKVKITSHLFKIYDCDGDDEMGNVSGFNPSVTGVTGLETAEVIEKVVSLVKPEAVLILILWRQRTSAASAQPSRSAIRVFRPEPAWATAGNPSMRKLWDAVSSP